MGKHLKVITWARWKVIDSFNPEYYTVFTVSILKPSWEYPIACAAMSIVKGKAKIFTRMIYEDLIKVYNIPDEYRERLRLGNIEAQKEANHICDHQKKLHKMSDLQPGSHVVRTDTGEIIAEVEQFLKEEK